jgi:uncharacterized protein with FMN-binding domain
MRRIALWFAGTATIVVLLLGYHTSTNRGTIGTTGDPVPGAPTGGVAATPSGTGRSSTSPPPTEKHGRRRHSPTHTSGSHSPKTATTRTVTGQTVATARGPVEVKLTVRGGKIIKVDVPVHPNADAQSQMINSYALPLLVHETIAAQGAKIDMVSGATITSGGYVQSLQSALDQAGI